MREAVELCARKEKPTFQLPTEEFFARWIGEEYGDCSADTLSQFPDDKIDVSKEWKIAAAIEYVTET